MEEQGGGRSGLRRVRPGDAFDDRATLDREGGGGVEMDDHGVRRIPANWRWGLLGATFTSFGVATAMVFPLSGALYTEEYGAGAAIIACVVTTIYTLAACTYIARHVINEGINSDLLSRSTFGYVGSSFIALLYAMVCSFYFAAEGSVMASALHESVPALPYWGWAVITSASFVVIGIFGMILLTKVQWLTMVFYFGGLLLAFWALYRGWDDRVSFEALGQWTALNPRGAELDVWNALGAISSYIGVLGAILAVFLMDTGRFIRREHRGLGAVFYVFTNVLFAVFIMYLVGIQMLAASGQPDPGVTLVRLIGPVGLFVTLVTQVRVNLLNLYGGTLGLANFFSRIFGFVPGRQFWVVPFLLLGTGIILTPFRQYFGHVSIYISIFLCGWVSTLIGERVFVRSRHALPSWSEVRRSYLPDYNVIGLVSMWGPVACSCVMATGLFGREVRSLAVPLAIVAPFFLPALLGRLLAAERILRAYVGRDIVPPPEEMVELHCAVCEKRFHRSDFAWCPYESRGWICSYCCMSELHCGTLCRQGEVPVSFVRLEAER